MASVPVIIIIIEVISAERRHSHPCLAFADALQEEILAVYSKLVETNNLFVNHVKYNQNKT